MNQVKAVNGYLFDVYLVNDLVHLWIITTSGQALLFYDRFHPKIYIRGNKSIQSRFLQRLLNLNGLAKPARTVLKRHFYSGQLVEALEVELANTMMLQKIHQKIYAFFEKLEIYHTDLDPAVGYMLSKEVFPLCKVHLVADQGNWITSLRALNKLTDFDYVIPPLKKMAIQLSGPHRLGVDAPNKLLLSYEQQVHEIPTDKPTLALEEFNFHMQKYDPDILLSTYGDQIIFPKLLAWSKNHQVQLFIDRDPAFTQRKIKTAGTSFNTYGSWIFRAPSYPLFGRWHIDSANSFVYKETEIIGILELARISSTPVQRIARASTGSALSNLETANALEKNYLIPWQKSALEKPKTALTLLHVDKGGLVYQPHVTDGFVKEQVAQLDFKQMYPSLMVRYNISPETVNCQCCARGTGQQVPETPYSVCQKREGVVAGSLHHVLQRRAYYKKEAAAAQDSSLYDARQSALKWMLVTSFGYLGYRNAKFGKLESHECVTAYGRNTLLKAKEIAEESGYQLSHAITDSIFIHLPNYKRLREEQLHKLCKKIYSQTEIDIAIEGIYSWLIFLPSKTDSLRPVANRYLGRFSSGKLKKRGIFARRKDIPEWIRCFQLELLEIMKNCCSVTELKASFSQAEAVYTGYMEQFEKGLIKPEKLFVRKTVSKNLEEYQVTNGTSESMAALKSRGLRVQPGEKVRFMVTAQKKSGRSLTVSEEELRLSLKPVKPCRKYYQDLLHKAFAELFCYFAPENYFSSDPCQPELFS